MGLHYEAILTEALFLLEKALNIPTIMGIAVDITA